MKFFSSEGLRRPAGARFIFPTLQSVISSIRTIPFSRDKKVEVRLAGAGCFCELLAEVDVECGRVSAKRTVVWSNGDVGASNVMASLGKFCSAAHSLLLGATINTKGGPMKALRTHVAGVDVHKDILAITIMIGAGDEDPRVEHLECSTMTDDLRACGLVLLEKGVKDVAMESTGVYWKPVHNVWEPLGLKVIIGNATHMKNVPGRKTDMNDSHWIAQLHRFGLIRASFVPGGVYQRLRLLSRHRTNLVEDLSRVKNRVEKVLQDGNIKWSSIVSDTFGVAGMKILDLIADGVTNAQTLAASVTTKIKRKEDAVKALTNCLTTEHIFVLQELLKQYRSIQTQIQDVENELTEKTLPYAHLVEELDKIPGIDKILAMAIIAEATADMSSFPDERKFAAWAGVASGNNESAGKKKDQNADTVIPTYEKS